MIGLVAGEDWTALEFRPMVLQKSMKWADVKLNITLPDKFWGEWGIAFNKSSMWIYRGHDISFHKYFWDR